MTNRPYQPSLSSLHIPAAYLGAVIAPQPLTPAAGAAQLIAAALRNPIGAPPLRHLAAAGQKVAILVDDCTRKTPVTQILPSVLAELTAAGVQPEAITLVIALGTHRPLTAAELEAKLGLALSAGCLIVNQSCRDDTAFAAAGSLHSPLPGLTLPPIPAYVNRAVLAADLRISIGIITPHLDAGFSGGAKMLLPGVCSLATVDAFHLASAFVPGNQLGNAEAPLRLCLEAFAAQHAPLHFIVNTILAHDGSLYGCVAGAAVAAQRAGVQYARQVYGVPAARRYPIVVAGCAPYEQDLWQSIKGAWAGDLLTDDGGCLILVTGAPEGNSSYPLVPHYAGMDPTLLRSEILSGIVEDAMQAATGVLWGSLRRRVRLSLVSAGLSAQTAEAMRIDYYARVEDAAAAALAGLPAAARVGAVAVVPQAGVVLPMPG